MNNSHPLRSQVRTSTYTGSVFQPRQELLKRREGSLDETPFPLLLHAIVATNRTCTLEVRLRNLEKQLVFEDGALVGCESNLLHETLGAWLVSKGKLTEAQHHQLFSESVASGSLLGALLIERKVLSAFELFKHLQANLAQRALDIFRWSGARWKLADALEVQTPIRLNTTRLIFTGCSQWPEALLDRHFALAPGQQLALNPKGPSASEALKLSAKELRLWNLLKTKPAIASLLASPGFTPEEIRRRLFAWSVLEMIDLAEEVSTEAPPPPTPPRVTAEVEIPRVSGVPFLDDDVAAMNLLATEYLTIRGKDPFDVLGVPIAFDGAAFQRAFVAKANAISPVRFKSSDSAKKAESLLIAYAKALGALTEFDSFEVHRKRREAPVQQRPKPAAAEAHFRIKTHLLDADTQFQEGAKRLAAGNYRGAVEHFQYACDIEPKARSLAYLAWAQFQLDPKTAAPKAFHDLEAASQSDPACEDPWRFRGAISAQFGRFEDAELAFKEACKLAPQNKQLADALQSVRARKWKGL